MRRVGLEYRPGYRPGYRQKGRALLGSAVLAFGLVGGLAGCGVAGASGTSGLTGGPAQNCGAIHVAGPGLQNPQQAQQDESCFYQAYQHCAPATLEVVFMGVDAGSDDHLATIAGGSGCAVKATVTHYIVPSNNTPTPQVSTCTTVAQSSSGLTLSNCGSLGTIVIPSQAGAGTSNGG